MRDLHSIPRRSRGDVRGRSQTSSVRLRDVKSQFYVYLKLDDHPYRDALGNPDLPVFNSNTEISINLLSRIQTPLGPPTNTMSGRTHQGRSVADHLEDDDERQYRQEDYAEARRNTGLNIEAYMTNSKITTALGDAPLVPTCGFMPKVLILRIEQKAQQMNMLADAEVRTASTRRGT